MNRGSRERGASWAEQLHVGNGWMKAQEPALGLEHARVEQELREDVERECGKSSHLELPS